MNSRFLEKHLMGYRRKSKTLGSIPYIILHLPFIHLLSPVVTELSEIVAVSVEGQKASLGSGGHNVSCHGHLHDTDFRVMLAL